MVHQPLPSYESISSRMQRKPFLCTSAPQIDSLNAQEMSAMTLHLILCLADILHHIRHPASVSLANTYMRRHLSALSTQRIIFS